MNQCMGITQKRQQCKRRALQCFCRQHKDIISNRRLLSWYNKRRKRLNKKIKQGLVSLHEFHDLTIPTSDLKQRRVVVPWR